MKTTTTTKWLVCDAPPSLALVVSGLPQAAPLPLGLWSSIRASVESKCSRSEYPYCSGLVRENLP